MTLEVPNLFIILAFAFFFGPMLILTLYGCLASFWRVKRKKKERQHETYYTEYHNEPARMDTDKWVLYSGATPKPDPTIEEEDEE